MIRVEKIRFITATIALLALAFTAGGSVADTDPRDVLAEHPLKFLDGAETTLSKFNGEVVVVSFWASWCAPCRKELPLMDEWNASWAGHGARVVAISIDEEARNAKRFVEQEDLSLTVLHDGPTGLASQLDLPSLPCTYILDRRGNVVRTVFSSSRKDLDSIRQEVEAMLLTSRDEGSTP